METPTQQVVVNPLNEIKEIAGEAAEKAEKCLDDGENHKAAAYLLQAASSLAIYADACRQFRMDTEAQEADNTLEIIEGQIQRCENLLKGGSEHGKFQAANSASRMFHAMSNYL